MNRKFGGAATLVYIILLCFSVPFLLVNTKGFPYVGIGILALFLSLIIYHYKTHKLKFDRFLLVFIAILSVFFVLRANGFTTFINLASLLAALSLLATNDLGTSFNGFLNAGSTPFLVFINTLFSKSKLVTLLKEMGTNTQPSKGKKLLEYFIPIIITIIALFIIIPLLASANPIFNDLVKKSLGMFAFDLSDIFIARTILFGIALFIIPKLISHVEQENGLIVYNIRIPIIPGMFIPKVCVAAVLALFLITHFELYFGGTAFLQTLGYSHAKLTNEVFAQLIIVCLIVFVLIYNDSARDKKARLLTALLLAQVMLLNLFALKSDMDYINQWGFTTKRLFGLVGVFLVFGVFFLYIQNERLQWHVQKYVKLNIAFVASVIVLINLLNFDWITYKYSMSISKTDHLYLSTLSTDTMHLNAHVAYLKGEFNSGNRDPFVLEAYKNELYKVMTLQGKYNSLKAWQTFNISEYLAYKSTKDLDYFYLLQRIQAYEQKNPPRIPIPHVNSD